MKAQEGQHEDDYYLALPPSFSEAIRTMFSRQLHYCLRATTAVHAGDHCLHFKGKRQDKETTGGIQIPSPVLRDSRLPVAAGL